MRTSIIIPAHNEEKRIGKTLEEYGKFFKSLKSQRKIDFEILLIINNTDDRTEEIIKAYSKIYSEIRYLNFKRGGKGYAITEGFKEALKRNFELMGYIDADMSTPPNAFYGMIRNIKNFDGIIANRWDKRSRIKKQNFLRRMFSRGFNFIVRCLFLFPYKDTQCGCKLFKRRALVRVIKDLYITHWAFDINLLYALRKNGFRVKEIPTEWVDKVGSKINIKKAPLMMFIGVIRLRLINSFFSFIPRLYDKFPEKLKIHHGW